MEEEMLPPYAEKYFDSKFKNLNTLILGVQDQVKGVKSKIDLFDKRITKLENRTLLLWGAIIVGTFVWVKESREFIFAILDLQI